MTIIVKKIGEQWTVEIDGQLVGRTDSERGAEKLIEAWRVRGPWVASWRFCQQ